MSRRKLTAAFSVVLTACLMPALHAQDRYQSFVPTGLPDASSAAPTLNSVPTMVANRYQPNGAPTPIDANPNQGVPTGAPQQQGYVRLGAPMYPTPRPNIPAWSGTTLITNQAFAPQEMLYPHTYRAIYPPYYHRVKGGWIVTPLGVRSHEHWELQGTQVQVKYRSSYPGLLSGAYWHPPATLNSHGPW